MGVLARHIPPQQRWVGAWCFPGRTEQHRTGWERPCCRRAGGTGGCGDPPGAASKGNAWSLQGWGLFGVPTPKIQPGLGCLEGNPPAFGKA